MKRGGAVYILTNKRHTVLYIGVTADLGKRLVEHKEKKDPKCFTARYNCSILLYHDSYHHIEEAIAEEKRLKGLLRSKKEAIISAMNPTWKDLFHEFVD